MQDTTEIIIDTQTETTASVIWLHGLGADGHDFAPLVQQLPIAQSMGIRFILPHAAVQPVTLNGGLEMRAWFDIFSLNDIFAQQDEAGIAASDQRVRGWIQAELDRGIPSERIILAGFSQGGAMALYSGLRYPKPLGGILALSTFLVAADRLDVEGAAANRAVPILLVHGRQDMVLPFVAGEWSYQQLQAHKYPVEWKAYNMQHEVCTLEIADVNQWLSERLQ